MMGLAGRSQSAACLGLAFDQLGMAEPMAFDSSAKLKLGGPTIRFSLKQSEFYSFDQHRSPPHGDGSWRQHRRSVLPPLERCGDQEDAWSGQKSLRNSRQSSLPASLRQKGGLQPLLVSVQQGPALRPSALSTNIARQQVKLKPEPKQMSAVAMDLGLSEHVPKLEQEAPEGELLLAAPEGPMEQHWFPFAELEAQVRKWRQEVPAPTPVSVQDLPAESDDDELMFASYSSARVRPGEFLQFNPNEHLEHELELDEEEAMATLTAKNAVDEGLHRLFAEDLSDDEGDWTDQEEV